MMCRVDVPGWGMANRQILSYFSAAGCCFIGFIRALVIASQKENSRQLNGIIQEKVPLTLSIIGRGQRLLSAVNIMSRQQMQGRL